jgi:hypothetical protein
VSHTLDSTQEVEAMRTVASALDPLPEEARTRVIAWAAALYSIRGPGTGIVQGTRQQGEAAVPNAGGAVTSFGTLAEFFDASDPQTESEKALVAGLWLQKQEGMSNLDSAAVNSELKQLGHAVTNVTMAFGRLIDQKPALAVQTAKAGKTRQARKKYMITKAGEKYVERMLSGENNESE